MFNSSTYSPSNDIHLAAYVPYILNNNLYDTYTIPEDQARQWVGDWLGLLRHLRYETDISLFILELNGINSNSYSMNDIIIKIPKIDEWHRIIAMIYSLD